MPVQVIKNTETLLDVLKEASGQIGFVPTMGNLHIGHQSLIERSVKENQHTIVSIFVNPLQFDKKQDLEKYPKTLQQDINMCETLKVDYIFTPHNYDIHHNNFFTIESTHPSLKIMEGKHRPAHFSGVLTVVMKLLQLVRPDRVYFGEKDYQQLILVKEMVEAFFLNCIVVPCETIRLKSGLPYSSRNNRLSAAELRLAESIIKIAHSEVSLQEKKEKIMNQQEVELEYLEVHSGRQFIAFSINDVRLIDNIVI